MVLRALRVVLFLLSALAVVGASIVAVRTVARPAALDLVEVSALERATRVVDGRPLYVEPGRADEPALMPGFPLAVAGLAQWLGPDIRQPRLLTAVALLILTLLVVFVVRLETESWTLAVASAGVLLLGYGLVAGPPGLTHPDVLVLVLALLGFLALRLSDGVAGALVAAVALAAACFTGVLGAWFAVAALVAMGLDRRARLVALACALTVLVGGGYVVLSRTLGPWFNFEAWDAPLRAWRPDAIAPLDFVGAQLLGRFGVLTLAAVLSFAMPTPPWRGRGGYWMCFGLAALAAGLAATQWTEARPGAMLPTIVALSLVGPISMQRVTRHLSAWPGSTRMGGQGVVLTALALQFIVFLSCVASSRTLLGAGS